MIISSELHSALYNILSGVFAVTRGTSVFQAPVVISRDHHDVSGTDSPFRETSNVYDGSAFCAGMSYDQHHKPERMSTCLWAIFHIAQSIDKIWKGRRNLAHQMKRFLNPLVLSHIYIREPCIRAHIQHLERELGKC